MLPRPERRWLVPLPARGFDGVGAEVADAVRGAFCAPRGLVGKVLRRSTRLLKEKQEGGYLSGNDQNREQINVISHQNGDRSDKLLRQGWTKGTNPLYPNHLNGMEQNRHFMYGNLDNRTSSFL